MSVRRPVYPTDPYLKSPVKSGRRRGPRGLGGVGTHTSGLYLVVLVGKDEGLGFRLNYVDSHRTRVPEKFRGVD